MENINSMIHFHRVMWIRNKVMKFLGITGHELTFYKLLNVSLLKNILVKEKEK